MVEALKRGPEVLAFLEEGKPKPAPERAETEPSRKSEVEPPKLAEVKREAAERPAAAKPKARRPKVEPEAEREGEEVPRTPVTFRLPSDLAERLVRASLTRKLAKKEPFSQQDIAAEAIAAWLEREGEA